MKNRYKEAKKVSILGMIGNVFLFINKIIIGIITNSQAMLADAFNSATDIFSSIMTYVGNRIASKKPDEDHDLGHGKAEYIYSMLISITMILLSLSTLKSSIISIYHPEQYQYNNWLIIVCIITIITKSILFIITNRIAKKHNNLLVKSNSEDHRNDVLITTLNLISVILSKYDYVYFDSIVGIIISLWILKTGINIFKESYDILMDKTLPNNIKEEVLAIVEKYPEIIKTNHFNATPVGYKYQISLTIFVDGNLTTFESHEIADRLEEQIIEEIEEIFLAVIHVNPIDVNHK